MKSKFLLTVALMFVALQIFAQERTFKSMGYDDASITGISGSLSYFLKIKPDDNLDQSSLVINLRASQVLNANNSFVVVYLKDEPVFTQRLVVSALDTMLTVRVPLSSKYLQPDGRFIKLRVLAKMSISEEYCKDIDNPACWVSVRNTSFINSSLQEGFAYQRSIKEMIQEFNSVYTPATADVDDLMAGGLIYTIVRQGAASKQVYTATYSGQEETPAGVVCGVADKLPYAVKQSMPAVSGGQGLIALVPVNDGITNRFVLVVTGGDNAGYKKAINTLANNKRLSSAFTDKLLISDATLSTEVFAGVSPLVTTLSDLGGEEGFLEGIGALRRKFNFSLADFNAMPTKLQLHLESYYSALKTDDRGFLNIYLNQNLVYNASLSDKSSFINDIDLMPHLLTKFNTLEIEFRFHPGSNICKDGFSNFFASINTKTSTLTYFGEKDNKFYSFFNFPAEFRKKQTKIVVSPALLDKVVASIGEIYYQLNSPQKSNFSRLVVPPIVTSTSATNVGDYNLIALVDRNDPFAKRYDNMPVKFDKDFQIYKGLQGSASYSVNDFSGSGLGQIFSDKGSTILMVTSLGADSSAGNAYLSVVKNFSTQLTEIESNVCIANSNGLSNYFFKAPDDNSIVSYSNNTSAFEQFWNAYKYWILGLILVGLVFGYVMIRRRVKAATDSVV